MQRTILKPFLIDAEAEETWLNEMASKGLMLLKRSFWDYTFTENPAEEYVHRVVLLAHKLGDKRNRELIDSAEANGAELIYINLERAYFREKTRGESKVFSTVAAELKHLEQAKKRREFLITSYVALAVISVAISLYLWQLIDILLKILVILHMMIDVYKIIVNIGEWLVLKREISKMCS